MVVIIFCRVCHGAWNILFYNKVKSIDNIYFSDISHWGTIDNIYFSDILLGGVVCTTVLTDFLLRIMTIFFFFLLSFL